jgi:hypothetical protein
VAYLTEAEREHRRHSYPALGDEERGLDDGEPLRKTNCKKMSVG